MLPAWRPSISEAAIPILESVRIVVYPVDGASLCPGWNVHGTMSFAPQISPMRQTEAHFTEEETCGWVRGCSSIEMDKLAELIQLLPSTAPLCPVNTCAPTPVGTTGKKSLVLRSTSQLGSWVPCSATNSFCQRKPALLGSRHCLRFSSGGHSASQPRMVHEDPTWLPI